MKQQHRFLIAFALCVGGCLHSVATTFAAEKPNVLVILADDLGYGDLGFTGSKDIKTPRLDDLAASGVVCRNGYVTHSFCGPSRAGLITGRYQARFGMDSNLANSPFDIHSGLPVTETTFAKRLQKSGYRTGVVGKWHLGGSYPFHPNNRGFDYFYGFLSGGHTYMPEKVTMISPLLVNGKSSYRANECSDWPLQRNGKAGEFNEYLTTALSRDAAEFVGTGDQPFCLYVAYNAPHAPLEAPAETIAKYQHIENPQRRIYAAMIDEMDRGIGIVLDALKKSGKFENTLIFFLSDNGGMPAKNGNPRYSSSGPFRHGKGSLYEGGFHVPFIIHWPAGIKKSGSFDGLVSALDIAATSVAVGGGDSSGQPLEGVNLIPYLNGEKTGSPHDALYWRVHDGQSWAVRTPTTKYMFDQKKAEKPELFDMATDPYESKDIVRESPERRSSMAQLWNHWNANNSANVFMSPEGYQSLRLKMYEDLYNDLKTEAATRKPTVIE